MSTDWIGEKEAIERIANIKRQTADEIFSNAGFKKQEWGKTRITYTRTDEDGYYLESISFEKNKRVIIHANLSMQELAAINKKVEELGWINHSVTRTLEYADNPITP